MKIHFFPPLIKIVCSVTITLSRFQSETPEQISKLFYLFEYRRHLKFESHSRRRRGGKNYGQIPLMVVPEVFMFTASIHQFKCKFEIFSPVLMLNLYPRTVISIYMGYFELQLLLLLSGFCCFTSMNFCMLLLLLCFINILKENPIVSFTSFFFFRRFITFLNYFCDETNARK